jgi:hypothetical protein
MPRLCGQDESQLSKELIAAFYPPQFQRPGRRVA